jgi:putative transposase
MTLEFVPGTLCAYGDRVVQIDGMDSLAHASVRDMASGNLIRVELAKLRQLPSTSQKKEIGYIPDAEWKRSAALARDLLDLVDQKRVAREDLEPLALRHGVGIRQLQRLRKKLQKDSRASALVRSPGGRPEGLNRLSDQVHALINRLVAKYYMRRERPAKMDLVERVRSVCRRLGLHPPSKNAVIRRIDSHLGYEADLKRLGRKVAHQLWKPRPGRLNAQAPLDLIQIDHTRVDVMVVSEDRQTVLGRPWITLAIDVCSRVVLGMYLSMDAPSSVSVSLCIEHSVLPKPEDAQEPGLWPVYGKPGCILVDNGKDLRAEALKRGCDEHGIELQWRPVRTPHYGAHIERLNGTLMRLCHLLPGTTFSNPREKGDYDSEARATLTLAELKDWLVEKICRYYHVRRHRGLGMPPLVAWQQAFTDEQGQIRPPPLVADPQNFRIDFLPYEFRRVNRTGIELHGSRYWHADLVPLLRSPESPMVRYDPRRRQTVWVRLADGQLVEVPAIAGPAAGDPARRTQLDAESAAKLDRAIDTHFEHCDEIEEQAAKRTRRARKKGAKARPTPQSAEATHSASEPSALSDPVSAPAEATSDIDARTKAVLEAVLADESAKVSQKGEGNGVPEAGEQAPSSVAQFDPVPAGPTPSHAPAPPTLRQPAVSPFVVEDWI